MIDIIEENIPSRSKNYNKILLLLDLLGRGFLLCVVLGGAWITRCWYVYLVTYFY